MKSRPGDLADMNRHVGSAGLGLFSAGVNDFDDGHDREKRRPGHTQSDPHPASIHRLAPF
jgi:hypothetical protein